MWFLTFIDIIFGAAQSRGFIKSQNCCVRAKNGTILTPPVEEARNQQWVGSPFPKGLLSIQKTPKWGAWVSQSFRHPTPDFGSGPEL